MDISFWDERYSSKEYVYGEAPNDFLVEAGTHLPPKARVLSLGEGEGRNAVYLAKQGHHVTAVDLSPVGMEKGRALAERAGVTLECVVADLGQWTPPANAFDAVLMVWLHLPSAMRPAVMRNAVAALVPGGLVLSEVYRPEQLLHKTGGPPSADALVSLKQMQEELGDLEWLVAREVTRHIAEGPHHHGPSATVQLVARKR